MKKIDFGQTIGILANVGVIAGIVFLALELSQNNKLLRAQSGYNMYQNRASYREAIFHDPELAEFYYRLTEIKSADELSPVERLRARMEIERRFLSWQWEYSQIVDGNLSPEEFRWRLAKDGPIRDEWERFKRGLRPDFVDWFEGLTDREN